MDKEVNKTERSSAVFYKSFFDSTKDLDDKTFREAWTALLEYAFYDEDPEGLTPISSMFFGMAKPVVDSSNQAKEWGKSGGRPKKRGVSEEKRGVFNSERGVSESKRGPIYDVDVDEDVDVDKDVDVDVDVDEESDSESDNNTHIPTMTEIKEENERCGYGLNEESLTAFVRYNREHGWKIEWKLALKKWSEHDHHHEKKRVNKFQNFPRNHDNDVFMEQIIAKSIGGNQ